MGWSRAKKRVRVEPAPPAGHSGRVYVLVVGGLLLAAIAWALWPPQAPDPAPATANDHFQWIR